MSAIPSLLMVVAGLAGSAASGQLRVDVLMPAELFFFTCPGMVLMAVAAVRQRTFPRLSAALPVVAAAALGGLALLPRWGIQLPHGLPAALLLVFDLTGIAAPVMGLLSVRRLRRATRSQEESL